MMQGIFFPPPSDPTAQLYKTIMSHVQDLITQNALQNQMTTVRNTILGITDELSWMPELVNESSEDVKTSYYLTVQHYLAVGVRTAFGDCYDNLASVECRSWREAGTVEISLDYAQMHLEVFSSIYALNSTSDGFKSLLRSKMKSAGRKYRCLLTHAYSVFKAFRNQGSNLHVKKKVKKTCKRDNGCTGGKYCTPCCKWSVQVKDNFLGKVVKEKEGKGYKFNTNDCKNAAKRESSSMRTGYLRELNRKLEAEYSKPIDELTAFLGKGTPEYSDPCA